MKPTELIPLANVQLVPRGIVLGLYAAAALFTVAALALVGYGLLAGELEHVLKQAGISLFVAVYAGIIAVVTARSDRRSRMTAPLVFAHVRPPAPLPVRAFALAFACAVVMTGLLSGWEQALRLGVEGSGMLGGLWLYVVLYRRSMHRQATVLFTLYADGLLDPASTTAIDDARQRDPAFDAAVREHQRVSALVTEQLR